MTDKIIKQQFILTLDKSVSEQLIHQGFTLLSDNNERYIFLNNSTLKFDKDEDKNILTKMAYTNVLCI